MLEANLKSNSIIHPLKLRYIHLVCGTRN